MNSNNSLLIDSAVALAEVETCSQSGAGGSARRIPTAGVKRITGDRGRRWSAEEDEFLRRSVGRIAEPEIARRLGRSVTAVHLRRERDLHLPCPRRHPEWLTLEQMAGGLGIDGHAAAALANRGILPARLLPAAVKMRVVDKKTALAWITDPMHWIYFRPERVGCFRPQGKRHIGRPDIVFWRQARKAVDEKRKIWKDAWLTPVEASVLIGITSPRQPASRLNEAILCGIIKAVRYGNWRILRSEAERFARERIVRNWGTRRINWIRFSDKPRMIYLRKLTKSERAKFEKRRLRAPFYADMRQRNREIRRRIRCGEDPKALAKECRLTVQRIKQIAEAR